jgi:hypothetical protein
MGVVRDENKSHRRTPELFTKTVEKLWKSGRLFGCKFGFSIRIWRFAQNLVSPAAAVEKDLYLIDMKSISHSARLTSSGSARET